ncbi:2-dehydropantoate 2-reductase [Bordetella bronchiseptica]|uniref:2-dehydropantoate 2-reductase n=1 Tax=Bordetella bronchiseptica TaxID=518 RepID=UPI000444E5DA|nr:2-dehydropantoate 2-reductase [Bordetella bronchiseptica]KDC78342.1 2-dehydropantoate 2-reductase [Bordetella bronchiseptica MBORD635]KDD27037.1 2-dehydropantoate 2-reductase [Bordetella bronchiseptica MBORD782]BAO71478.1 2-dehydropantoate 2-reductase [Bordetella bronchiseptica]VTQ68283.1 2-dehydropantoate 2-reductase [Bordetella bronchiseptica]
MRILVLGAGGTGGYFGGRAAQAGADVTFLVREARAARLREQGLRIKSPRGDATLAPRLVTAATPSDGYDVVVLSCKAYDLDSAIEAIRPAMGEHTAVLPIMNGVLQYDVLEREFGAHRVLGGLCQINASLGPEGEIVHMGRHASLVFGERAGQADSARCVALRQALADAAFDCRLSEDIHQDVWEKFVFLTSLAAATCLMRATVGQICSTGDGVDFMRALLRESQQVAAASGHPVRPAADASALKVLTDPAQPMTASMFRDLRQGRPVEADHIVGDMARRGSLLGVDTPNLRVACIHLQAYQAQRAIDA